MKNESDFLGGRALERISKGGCVFILSRALRETLYCLEAGL